MPVFYAQCLSASTHYMSTSCNVPAISASGPEHNQTIPKLAEQTRNFQEYRFYRQWAAGSKKTVDCQVEAMVMQTK
jgi:hypothetical protein